MKVKEVIKMIEQDGWVMVRRSGFKIWEEKKCIGIRL